MIEERNLAREKNSKLENSHLNEMQKIRKQELTRIVSTALFSLVVGLIISFAFLF